LTSDHAKLKEESESLKTQLDQLREQSGQQESQVIQELRAQNDKLLSELQEVKNTVRDIGATLEEKEKELNSTHDNKKVRS
jgi:uncharacterized coiled-coil DUF342 family protein